MPDGRIKIGLQTLPQMGGYPHLRDAWQRAEALGVDSLWVWDHFFPLHASDPDGAHFELFSLLAAMAEVTSRVSIGSLVASNSYRNPNLLADMARTIDQISGGRFILGLGAGWSERDHAEYGYPAKTGPERLRDLAADLPVIEKRLARLNPGPVHGRLPLLIGGSGEKVTLKLAARYATMWNGGGVDPAAWARANRVLDDWCDQLGRDPNEIERTALIWGDVPDELADASAAAGAQHLIVSTMGSDWDTTQLERLIAWRDRRQAETRDQSGAAR